MRVFDWQKFVDEQHIEHIDRGANVGRNEINIKCPFCGSADPSYHMGLNLETGWWACWRNRHAHSGKSPLRLIVQLLRIPYWKARQLAGLDQDYVDPDGFDALVAKIMHRDNLERVEQVQRRILRLPDAFHLIQNWGRSRNHFNYLRNTRGFAQHTEAVIDRYALCFDKGGEEQPNRIIFPYEVDGDLVTWTGRAIGSHPIRYKDLELAAAIVPAKDTLYNHDCIIAGGKVLCVVEGPMDTCKMDYGGRVVGVRTVGLSTNSITEEQVYLLEEASSQFDRVVFLMDNKSSGLAIVDSMRIREQVATVPNAFVTSIPKGYKDCGEMSIEACEDFARTLI